MAEATRKMTVEAPVAPSAEPQLPAMASIQPLVRPVELSILIVTWNSERWIERCLQSIAGACEGLSYEVVVHDNASEDTTVTLLGDNVRILRGATNDGFAAGTNRAFAESRGRYVFLLNPDCELAPRALKLLYEFLETHPDAAAAAPLLVDESGDSQREFQLRRFPSVGILASQILLLDKLLPNNRAIAHYRYRDLDLTEPRKVEQPAAAALMIRRDVFNEVGPFDEQFAPAWFVDVDYCRRLAAAKKGLYVVPAASARHFGGASLEHMPFARFIDTWYRNMWRYAQKWLPAGQRELLRWVIIGGMALRCVAAVLGFAHPDVGRLKAFRAYAHVLGRAFHRWSTR